ncbi:sporulation protein SsgA [Amycolatopsis antarctica]|uniref:Sporulation protein SsgA n=1 Tax=Amycolatopsis antarctica TaxID=1854586 RepID=A0A263CYR0_9PSEU|nr:SsgA family sporulation/cell division regulator [Amycolatopsis antarctica]OZM71293.1 sporulation protein SsgA [Amycolatopsis antarctica]
MRHDHATVSATTILAQIAPPTPVVPVKAELGYDTRVPYAVTITCAPAGEDGRTVWELSRDLLVEGLDRAAGDGDVRVRRSPEEPECLLIEVRGGAAVFDASTHEVAEFLRLTFHTVPLGAEAEWIDLEGLVGKLLLGPG